MHIILSKYENLNHALLFYTEATAILQPENVTYILFLTELSILLSTQEITKRPSFCNFLKCFLNCSVYWIQYWFTVLYPFKWHSCVQMSSRKKVCCLVTLPMSPCIYIEFIIFLDFFKFSNKVATAQCKIFSKPCKKKAKLTFQHYT